MSELRNNECGIAGCHAAGTHRHHTTDEDLRKVHQTLARFSLALGADWADTGLNEDRQSASEALARIQARLDELEVVRNERDLFREEADHRHISEVTDFQAYHDAVAEIEDLTARAVRAEQLSGVRREERDKLRRHVSAARAEQRESAAIIERLHKRLDWWDEWENTLNARLRTSEEALRNAISEIDALHELARVTSRNAVAVLSIQEPEDDQCPDDPECVRLPGHTGNCGHALSEEDER
jgi:hypothetical protein